MNKLLGNLLSSPWTKVLVFAVCLVPFLLLLWPFYKLVTTGIAPELGANPVEYITHDTGNWTIRFLLITLCITPLRKILNQPKVIRYRRMLGLFAFFYVVLHFTVYLVLDLELNFATLGADIVKRPYITIGFTGLLLLIPLAVTSTNAMQRRLGRRWQTLHRLVYVIAVLGVWHFYWQVKRDVREPLVYAGILAVLLFYRLLRSRQRAAAALTSRSGSATAPGRT